MSSRFIPGIYNHCNRWCERCPHTERCLVFAEMRHYEALAAGRPSVDPIEELGPPTPEAKAFFRELEEAQQEMTERDLEEFGREQKAVDARISGDATNQLATRLSRSLWSWTSENPVSGADVLLVEARDVVGHYGLMLGAKVHRALHGYYEKVVLGDGDMFEADSLGTAKLVLEAIDALEPAVEALALVYPEDPVLRTAFAELPVLRDLIEGRFPAARSFVRDGLDDDSPSQPITNLQ